MRLSFASSRSIVAMTFAITSLSALAEDQPASPTSPAVGPPAWMTTEVVKAAVDIHMNDTQQHEFNDAVGEFVSSHFTMIQKELRKEAPDLEQRVKSRDGVLVRQMDTRLRPVLTTEQWPAYESYKKTLRAQLKDMPLPQGSANTRTPHGVGGGRG